MHVNKQILSGHFRSKGALSMSDLKICVPLPLMFSITSIVSRSEIKVTMLRGLNKYFISTSYAFLFFRT